jgi:hypothetical protein
MGNVKSAMGNGRSIGNGQRRSAIATSTSVIRLAIGNGLIGKWAIGNRPIGNGLIGNGPIGNGSIGNVLSGMANRRDGLEPGFSPHTGPAEAGPLTQDLNCARTGKLPIDHGNSPITDYPSAHYRLPIARSNYRCRCRNCRLPLPIANGFAITHCRLPDCRFEKAGV